MSIVRSVQHGHFAGPWQRARPETDPAEDQFALSSSPHARGGCALGVFRALGRIRVQGQLTNSVLLCDWSAGYVFFFPIPSQLRIFSHRLAMRRVYARLA